MARLDSLSDGQAACVLQAASSRTSSVRGGTPWSSGGTRTPPVPPWLFADILRRHQRPQAPQAGRPQKRGRPPWDRGLLLPRGSGLSANKEKKVQVQAAASIDGFFLWEGRRTPLGPPISVQFFPNTCRAVSTQIDPTHRDIEHRTHDTFLVLQSRRLSGANVVYIVS